MNQQIRKTMKNTKLELQEEMRKVNAQIREQQKNLRNSKQYLKYLQECFEDESHKEEEKETNEFGDLLITSCVSCGEDVYYTNYNGHCSTCG